MSELTKKSGVIYLAVFLLIVCGIATALMAVAKLVTDEPIKTAEKASLDENLGKVLAGLTYTGTEKAEDFKVDKMTLYKIKNADEVVAYVVKNSCNGYSGEVEGLISFDKDGRILCYVITKQTETPGIGTKVTDRVSKRTITDVVKGTPVPTDLPPNATLDSFKGKQAAATAAPWDKDDVQFVTGATITSTAVTKLAWDASCALNEYMMKEKK